MINNEELTHDKRNIRISSPLIAGTIANANKREWAICSDVFTRDAVRFSIGTSYSIRICSRSVCFPALHSS